ncbi:MAG: 30S ribosomal protein S7 [Candidatus Woykebacteria bacterium RIFCSPHIGHO2_01_FULL_43_29]|uniref:Small ribosomal subunit protein uS7 n=2 Tax=Candidatus Woykeibacteriota TaxID=1817899 RepID=A0A1G1WXF1_9BACT|nr:MAG: 30S ribosomal protein S7 [Candidatus Woykebacteria bacterium RIFCSPHIGHO2_01_FULL_43_29]OGY28686.1 MAG: 30S ribosomal protein S7 [Candidatus Woykebacteria bacterium RIFCSPHIGHO2_02_FULL_43_16b]OGY32436.1 MAG: 30S ribosomal protein S7 [Candidatus Woykebacteria bacterium RIFCSPLOWO2_01_FULL_43_14]
MARGRVITKKVLDPDPIYDSRLVTRFINRIMKDGKKSVAQKVMYSALEKVATKTGKNALDIFEVAMKNTQPRMEVRPRRVGGASYQVPMEVRGDRKEALAIRWVIIAADARSSRDFRTMADKLAAEIIDASNNTGAAIKKKDDTHRMAEANKAFSHFRW